MRERRTARRDFVLTALAMTAGALVAPGGPAGAAPTTAAASAPTPAGDIEVVDLPAGITPMRINDRGQIVASAASDSGPSELVVVEDGGVTSVGTWQPHLSPLCPEPICWFAAPYAVAIDDRGVVGADIRGHASLWHDGTVTDLNGSARGSWFLDLNDRGEALVVRFMDDHQVIGLWHDGRFTEVRSLPLRHHVRGHVSDRGHVMVSSLVVGPTALARETFVWRDGVVTDIPGFLGVDVNRYGQMAGAATLPGSADLSRPAVWDDGEVTLLPTSGGQDHGAVAIDDHGRVVGHSTHPDDDRPVAVLWDGGAPIEIAAALGPVSRAVAIDRRGRVLLHAGDTGAVWREGQLRVLPGDDVTPIALNDRGQVIGLRGNDATLWDLQGRRRQDRP